MPLMINYMEKVVNSMLKSVLKDIDHCDCENCLLDIKAITLNSLPSKYVVTKEGEVYQKINTLQQQFEVDVTAAITKATEIVKRNPHHSE